MSKKVAYARSHAGFVISEKGKTVLAKVGFSAEEIEGIEKNHEHRDDPRLISCIEKLGSSFNGAVYGWTADVCIAEIPDGYSPIFSRYDGLEAVTGFPGPDILRKEGLSENEIAEVKRCLEQEERSKEEIEKK